MSNGREARLGEEGEGGGNGTGGSSAFYAFEDEEEISRRLDLAFRQLVQWDIPSMFFALLLPLLFLLHGVALKIVEYIFYIFCVLFHHPSGVFSDADKRLEKRGRGGRPGKKNEPWFCGLEYLCKKNKPVKLSDDRDRAWKSWPAGWATWPGTISRTRNSCSVSSLSHNWKDFFVKKAKNFLGAMNFVMPNKYQGFSRSLEKVLKEEDRSGKKTKTSVYIKN